MRYRLIKPDWGKPDKIVGPNTFEGEFSHEFLQQKNELGYNVYYFPNFNSQKLDHPYLRGSDIDVINCCFVDMDLKDGVYPSCEKFVEVLKAYSLPPHRIVYSGNGVHAYWYADNLTVESYLEIQLRLIQRFQTDSSIWTLLQLMRLPGFYNTKNPDDRKMVKEEWLVADTVKVSAVELLAVLPELSDENKRKIKMHLQKLTAIDELEQINEETIEVPPKFIYLLENSQKMQKLWGAEQGERSNADFEIAQILYEREFTKQEALAVILNTSKALSKGAHRKSYAVTVVSSAYADKAKHFVPSVADKLARGILSKQERGRLVRGPKYFDCFVHNWRTSEVLGLIGSPSSGKTTVTLDMFYNMVKNDPTSDDIFIFFSLEMEDYKIIEQWVALTKDMPHLAERFFVISNEDEEGNSRYLNLQDIYCFIKDISKVTGKKVKAIAIDHVGLINKSIDIKRKPDFGLVKRDDLGFGSNRTISDRELTKFVKSMAKELDVFIVLQSQTTKGKADEGDVALGLGAAYGIAQFEWDMDYIMTIWQPLKRVRNKTELTITAYQYCKNRYVKPGDRVKVYDPRVLYVDLNTGRFRNLRREEFDEFVEMNKEASAIRKLSEKKQSDTYSHSEGDTVKEVDLP